MLEISKQILKKKEIIASIEKKISKSSAVIFYNFSFAQADEIFSLKKDLEKLSCSWHVYKNTLFKKALKNALKIDQYSEENLKCLSGNNAFIFCDKDEYSLLKPLKNFDFRNTFEDRIKGGIYNGYFVNGDKLKEWSYIPSKESLIFDFCNILMFEVFRFTDFIKEVGKQGFSDMNSKIDNVKVESIIEMLSSLSLIDLKNLNDKIKEKYGIDSSVTLQGSVDSQQSSNKENAEKSFYTLTLNSVGSQKMQVYKMLKEMMEDDISIIEVKRKTDNLPYIVSDKVDKEKAEEWKSQLESAGASLEMKKN